MIREISEPDIIALAGTELDDTIQDLLFILEHVDIRFVRYWLDITKEEISALKSTTMQLVENQKHD